MREVTSRARPRSDLPTTALSLWCPSQTCHPVIKEENIRHMPPGGTFWSPWPGFLTPGRCLKQEPKEVWPPACEDAAPGRREAQVAASGALPGDGSNRGAAGASPNCLCHLPLNLSLSSKQRFVF